MSDLAGAFAAIEEWRRRDLAAFIEAGRLASNALMTRREIMALLEEGAKLGEIARAEMDRLTVLTRYG